MYYIILYAKVIPYLLVFFLVFGFAGSSGSASGRFTRRSG